MKSKLRPKPAIRGCARNPSNQSAASRRSRVRATRTIRDDLPPKGRRLLKLIVTHLRTPGFRVAQPETYLGYKECCEHLKLIPDEESDMPWGRLLARNGMAALNEWAMRHNIPAVTGVIVNRHEESDRYCQPGGDYFKSNGHPDPDFDWWERQVKMSVAFDWQPFLR